MCRSMSHSVQIRRCIRAKGNAGINTIPFAPKQTIIISNWWPVHADCVVETTTTIEVRSISILPMANGSSHLISSHFTFQMYSRWSISICAVRLYHRNVETKCVPVMSLLRFVHLMHREHSNGLAINVHSVCTIALKAMVCVCDTSSEMNLNGLNQTNLFISNSRIFTRALTLLQWHHWCKYSMIVCTVHIPETKRLCIGTVHIGSKRISHCTPAIAGTPNTNENCFPVFFLFSKSNKHWTVMLIRQIFHNYISSVTAGHCICVDFVWISNREGDLLVDCKLRMTDELLIFPLTCAPPNHLHVESDWVRIFFFSHLNGSGARWNHILHYHL